MLTYPAVAHSSNSESLIKRGQGCLPLTQTYPPTNTKACRHLLCDRSTFSSHRKCSFLAQATQSQQNWNWKGEKCCKTTNSFFFLFLFFSLCRTGPCKEPQGTRGNELDEKRWWHHHLWQLPRHPETRAMSYQSMPRTRANRSSAIWNYQNHLKSKYQLNCKFHFHDIKPSTQLTDLEIMLFHKQVIS